MSECVQQSRTLTFTDKEVGCCLCDDDGMLAVVNSLLGGPLKHILLWVPLGSTYGILLGWSREVMVTMRTYLEMAQIFTQPDAQ